MCNGSMIKPSKTSLVLEDDVQRNQEGLHHKISILLEFSASDDIAGFKDAIEKKGHDICEVGLWYGRRIGSKKMGYEERTPLMIAAMFASKNVLSYILQTGKVDVNQACGSDGATALHCAVDGGSSSSADVIKLLLNSSANVDVLDANGNRSRDLIVSASNSIFTSRNRILEAILQGDDGVNDACFASNEAISPLGRQERTQEVESPHVSTEKKDYPIDLPLPDIKNEMYSTDEFRMYTFKVKPCSRPYSHDWTECPFVHPGENARRRDPTKYQYSCVLCPDFRKGSCSKGDSCEYAHGIFECWLHPAQYRTRLCKDEMKCNRRVCFFAHKLEELRPLYASTGSALPSPTSYSSNLISSSSLTPPLTPPGGSSPPMWQTHPHVSVPTLQLPKRIFKKSVNGRDVDLDIKLIGLENRRLMQHQMMDDMSSLSSSPSKWKSSMPNSPSSFQDSQLQSPTRRVHQNVNQPMIHYSCNHSTSNVIGSPSTALNSRNATFSDKSQSFCNLEHPSPTSSAAMEQSTLFGWGSQDGKLDWSVRGDELNKARKSISFGFRNNTNHLPMDDNIDEYDASWVNSLLKDGTSMELYQYNANEKQHQELEHHLEDGTNGIPSWF